MSGRSRSLLPRRRIVADATMRAAEVLAEPTYWDDVMGVLRREGFSKVATIRATAELLRISLSEAKRRVHSSRAWADRREADERFHDALTDTLGSERVGGPTSEQIQWSHLWERVAVDLSGHTDRGNLGLLTEDSVRWATAVWLQRLGVSASHLQTEVPASGRGRIDLTVEPRVAAIEFKFPRPPRSGKPPFTQHAGAVLADVIVLSAEVEYASRFIVVLLLPAFEKHFRRRGDVRLPLNAGGQTEIDEDAIERLPETARRKLPSDVGSRLPVLVRCSAVHRFDAFALAVLEPGASPISTRNRRRG